MNRLAHVQHNAQMRRKRVRSTIQGTNSRPRLSVKFSIRHISAQLIDDTKGVTLAYCSTVGKNLTQSQTEKAEIIGKDIATAAKAIKIKQVVFDRGDKLYHGRLKALAEAARKEGLEF